MGHKGPRESEQRDKRECSFTHLIFLRGSGYKMLNGNLPSSGSENGAYSTPVLAWCPRFAPWFWALTLAKEDLYDRNLLKPIMAVAAPLPILEV